MTSEARQRDRRRNTLVWSGWYTDTSMFCGKQFDSPSSLRFVPVLFWVPGNSSMYLACTETGFLMSAGCSPLVRFTSDTFFIISPCCCLGCNTWHRWRSWSASLAPRLRASPPVRLRYRLLLSPLPLLLPSSLLLLLLRQPFLPPSNSIQPKKSALSAQSPLHQTCMTQGSTEPVVAPEGARHP